MHIPDYALWRSGNLLFLLQIQGSGAIKFI